MASIKRKAFTRFLSYTNVDGTEKHDFRDDCVGKEGLLYIFDCSPDGKHNGQSFVYFFPNEPELFMQNYFHTSCGEIIIDNGNDVTIKTANTITIFGGESSMSDQEKVVLELNSLEMIK